MLGEKWLMELIIWMSKHFHMQAHLQDTTITNLISISFKIRSIYLHLGEWWQPRCCQHQDSIRNTDCSWKEDRDRLGDCDDSGLEEQRRSQTIWASARAVQRKQRFIWSRSSAIPMSISLAEDESETEDRDKPSDRSYSCWKLPKKKPHPNWSERASDVPRHIIPDTDLKKAGIGECSVNVTAKLRVSSSKQNSWEAKPWHLCFISCVWLHRPEMQVSSN